MAGNSASQSKRIKIWGTLALILLIGAALRLIFFTGMVRGDALNYAHAAYSLSQGLTDLGDWGGVSRIGAYGPVALLYALFGPSQLTTLAFPFLSSLATMLYLFRLGRLVADEGVGLIAALLWAFFPLDVHLATTLLPDVPVAALLTASLYHFLKGMGAQRLLNREIIIGWLLILLAIIIKPVAIIGGIAAIALILNARWAALSELASRLLSPLGARRKQLLALSLLLAAIAGLSWYARIQPYPLDASLAKTASDLTAFFFTGFTELEISDLRLDFSSLLIFFAPIYLIAVVWALKGRNRLMKQVLLWLSIVFFYYELGTINLDPLFYVPLQPFNEARNFLFLMPPLMLVVAAYLDALFPLAERSLYVWLAALLGLGAAWLARDAHWDLVPVWLSLAALLLIPLAILSLAPVATRSPRTGSLIGAALLVVICIASLRPASPYHSSWYWGRIERIELLREAVALLEDEGDLPILINGRGNAMTLNYASDFALGFDWTAGGQTQPVRISPTESQLSPPYYLIEFNPEATQARAQLIARFEGRLGGQLSVWRLP